MCTAPSYLAVIPRPRGMDILMLSTLPAKICQNFSLAGKVAGKQQLSIGECSYANCTSPHFIVLRPPYNAAAHFSPYRESLDFWLQFLFSQDKVFFDGDKLAPLRKIFQIEIDIFIRNRGDSMNTAPPLPIFQSDRKKVLWPNATSAMCNLRPTESFCNHQSHPMYCLPDHSIICCVVFS